MFVWKFNLTLAATVTQETGANIQYLCTLLRGEALSQFDLLSDDLENTDAPLTVIILLSVYPGIFPCGFALKTRLAMRCCMKNTLFKSEAPCSAPN